MLQEIEVNDLTFLQKVLFTFGNVYNDMCGSMWFTYLLLFMVKVIQQNPLRAGIILFFGQLCDAIATPLIGYESDKMISKYYGRRKIWHLGGTICVFLSFPFIFCPFPFISNDISFGDNWGTFFYYLVLVMIFQFGWAAVQLSHLSLIPDLTYNTQERSLLTSMRYISTLLSSVFVYLLCFIVFYWCKSEPNDLNKSDSKKFIMIAWIINIVGIMFSIVFHATIKESTPERIERVDSVDNYDNLLRDDETPFNSHQTSIIIKDTQNNVENLLLNQKLGPMDWFKFTQFYQLLLCYTFSRLFVNVTQVYCILYILDHIHLDKKYAIAIPFFILLGGLLISMLIPCITRNIGVKMVTFVGVILSTLLSLWYNFIDTGSMPQKVVFINQVCLSITLGATGAILLVSTQDLINQLIGVHIDSSGFVLGVVSFADKALNGIVVLILQIFLPKYEGSFRDPEFNKHIGHYYKYIIVGISGGCAIAICILLLSLIKTRIGYINVYEDGNIDNDYYSHQVVQ